MTMFAVLTKKKSGARDVGEYQVALAEDLPRAEHLRERAGSLAKIYMDYHWQQLDDEVFGIIRRHLANAGSHADFIDDAVHGVVLELLEFRRIHAKEPGEILEGLVGGKPLCSQCQTCEEHHGLDTVKCKKYQAPPAP